MRLILGVALLVGSVVLAYAPALHGGFVWDDDLFLTRNPLIREASGLRRLWLTTEPHDYWPVTYTILWIEWRMWGMHPAGYHAVSLLLHLAAALLLWSTLKRLRIPGAFLGALLFAVHPVNAESVAWITQQKNLVAMVFFLLSIRCFLETDPGAPASSRAPPGARRWYGLSLLAFALAMLGKGSVAPLPVVLLGIVAWHRRLRVRDWIRLVPFFAAAAVFTAANLWFQSHVYTHFRTAGWGERVLGASAALWFYLGKAIWPARLCFAYPLWTIHTGELRWWMPLIATVGATVALGILGRRERSSWGRGVLFAWLYFGAMLTPVPWR